MTVAKVRTLYPKMRSDVCLCFISLKSGANLMIVGVPGRGGRLRWLNLFLVHITPEIVQKHRRNIAAIKVGMSEEAVRRRLGEPTKTGSMGGQGKKIKFLYYGNWVLHFQDGKLTRENNKPQIDFSEDDPLLEEKLEGVFEGTISVLASLTLHGFIATVNTLGSKKTQMGEVWRTKDAIFLFWDGKLSRWGKPGDNLLDEMNSLDVKRMLYVPIPVTMLSIFPPSTVEHRDAIRKGEVSLGMSHLAVRASLGNPRDINRTVLGDRVVQEQWVYGTLLDGRYLYFDEDGKLDAWQD